MNTKLLSSRAELLCVFDEFLEMLPSLRVGQAICNLTMMAGREANMWDVEDDELLTAMREMIDSYKQRSAKIPA